jgi:type II secretory pathway pseudopilin PulG
MAVMAIFLTVAVQSASFQAQREKEEELIFRGQQAVEAIRLFRARNGRFPLTLDELVKAKPRVIRKPWVDPMTGKADWLPIYLGEEGTTVAGGGSPGPTPTPRPGGLGRPGTARGPIIGVRSRVCTEAIKIYEGRTKYCEWKFFFDPQKASQPGQPKPPGPTPRPPKDD